MPTIIIREGDIDKNGTITGSGSILVKEDNGKKVAFIGVFKEDEKVFGVLQEENIEDNMMTLYIGDFKGTESDKLIRLDIKPSSIDFYLSDSQNPNNFLTQIARKISFIKESMQEKHPGINPDIFDRVLESIESIRKEMEDRGMEGRVYEWGSASSQCSFYSCSGEENVIIDDCGETKIILRRSSSDPQLSAETPSTTPENPDRKNPYEGHYPRKLADFLDRADRCIT